MQLARRTVLSAGLGVLAAGCAGATSAEPQGRAPGTPTTPSSGPSSGPSTEPSAGPAAPPWQPSPGDLEPDCKRAAVRAVEAATAGRGQPIEVIDVQYGGLLTDAASVLVVTRWWPPTGGGRTFDVRVNRRGGRWRVDAVHPSRPGPAGRLSPSARRVLAEDRIDLPPAARRDVQSGRVHDSVLGALLTLAQDHRIGVSVLRSGHPLDVFGTTRPSDHPQGQAFDTWQIDGLSVVDPRTSRQLVTEYMHAAAAAGSYNVGGPYLLGSAPQWFSDATHHDHVHAGFLA